MAKTEVISVKQTVCACYIQNCVEQSCRLCGNNVSFLHNSDNKLVLVLDLQTHVRPLYELKNTVFFLGAWVCCKSLEGRVYKGPIYALIQYNLRV